MKRRPNRWLRPVVNLAVVVVLLTAVSFLPPDTSLADRQKTGVLKLCVPPSYPPLVTGNPDQPGFDIELADAMARQIGLRLTVNTLASMGKDFNPRNWSLTRGQCDVIAGGVTDTVQTRSFLQTVPTPVQTGWMGISRDGHLPPSGESVAVLPGTTGLDRLQLSSWLRQNGWKAVPVRSPQQFAAALADRNVGMAIAESAVVDAITLPPGMQRFWLPEDEFPHYRMALGLWKGDLTLKRAIDYAIAELTQSGALGEIAERYGTNRF